MQIERYTNELENLVDLLQMSMGIESHQGVNHLIAIERARGTRYYVARDEELVVGVVGVWFDPTGATSMLEPPQIIDLAVLPTHRRQGIARALMNRAISEVRTAGHPRLWLYTDGNSINLFAFYRKLGFQLAAVVPDWFGEGTVKAIFRLDL